MLVHGASSDAKNGIERAEAHEAGSDKDDRQHAQYDGHGSRDHVGEIEHCYHSGDQDPHDAVDISHIFFHRFKGLGEYKRSLVKTGQVSDHPLNEHDQGGHEHRTGEAHAEKFQNEQEFIAHNHKDRERNRRNR